MACSIDSTITRCRKNERGLFNKKEDISYNKYLALIGAGRFNLPKQSMFYGSLPTYRGKGEFIDYGNQCPMFEVCKELQNHKSLSFPTFFTLSFWKTMSSLRVVSLCYEGTHLLDNTAISKPTIEYQNGLKSKYSDSEYKCIQDVWKYFAELSIMWDENNCNHYNILTAFYSMRSVPCCKYHGRPYTHGSRKGLLSSIK